jgi:hypothetical protein
MEPGGSRLHGFGLGKYMDHPQITCWNVEFHHFTRPGKHTKNDGKIHHFQWVNPRTKWAFSIAICMFTRGYHHFTWDFHMLDIIIPSTILDFPRLPWKNLEDSFERPRCLQFLHQFHHQHSEFTANLSPRASEEASAAATLFQ